VAVAVDAFFIVSLNNSAKVILLALKAVLLTLARLLPATSNILWWACNPVTPDDNAKLIFVSP
jgi:hypothetical protein